MISPTLREQGLVSGSRFPTGGVFRFRRVSTKAPGGSMGSVCWASASPSALLAWANQARRRSWPMRVAVADACALRAPMRPLAAQANRAAYHAPRIPGV